MALSTKNQSINHIVSEGCSTICGFFRTTSYQLHTSYSNFTCCVECTLLCNVQGRAYEQVDTSDNVIVEDESLIYLFIINNQVLWKGLYILITVYRLIRSCSTSGTRRVNLVTNPVISHKWGNDREVFTTSGTYPWLFVKQIFHRGQPSRGGDHKIFEVMTSTLQNVFIFRPCTLQSRVHSIRSRKW
jgi:hypothetical protein